MQCVLHPFATKFPPYHVTTESVTTLPVLVQVDKTTGYQRVRSRGGATAVMYEINWKGFLRHTWERELDLQTFCATFSSTGPILSYWASAPDQRQPHARQYQQMRISAAARELARAKGERHLPGSNHLVTADVYRSHFISAPLPIGASIWYHSFNGSRWLGKVTQHTAVPGQHIIRCIDSPGPILIDLNLSTYNTALLASCGSWCLQTHG